MTAPRQILRDKTYFITRRTTQGQYLLVPSEDTNRNIEYCLALAALYTGVLLHAVCFMSNHWHGVLSDPEARLPEFLERFHRLLAKCQNAHLGRRENFWSSHKTSVVLLASHAAVVEKMTYTLTNPTNAGLVDSPHEWPGVTSQGRAWQAHTVYRPRLFFDPLGRMPKQTQLTYHRPSIYPELSDEGLLRLLAVATAEEAERARNARAESGIGALGAEHVVSRQPTSVPESTLPFRDANPRVASKSPAHRVQAILGMLAFVRAYRQAWQQWRDGARDVIFPAGTYALRIYSGVACAPS